ncbi:hypothetical protein HUU51_04250 [Candidatus Gracilibacteria bacterium]|nr:hypothetical protein [Candidatus Gracilibacteria bacterium]
MTNLTVQINQDYKEKLDLLKQIIPNMDGSQITDDGKMVEVLIETFIGFLQEQAMHEHGHDHNHGDDSCGTGGCGCSH